MSPWEPMRTAESLTYQENNRNVEHEGNGRINEEREAADAVDVIHGQDRQLGEQADYAVHDCAGRSIVVERDKGIHLEFRGAEQSLNRD